MQPLRPMIHAKGNKRQKSILQCHQIQNNAITMTFSITKPYLHNNRRWNKCHWDRPDALECLPTLRDARRCDCDFCCSQKSLDLGTLGTPSVVGLAMETCIMGVHSLRHPSIVLNMSWYSDHYAVPDAMQEVKCCCAKNFRLSTTTGIQMLLSHPRSQMHAVPVNFHSCGIHSCREHDGDK